MESKKVLIRTTTIPSSIRGLLQGQLKYMSQYYDVVAVTSGGPDYDIMLEEQCVRGYIVPFTRKAFSLGSDIKAFFMLIRIFRKEKPFIVHSHTSKDGLLCMVAAWLCRVPNRLYTIAGLADIPGIRGFLLNQAEWLTFRCATGLYPISKNMMEIYLKRGLFHQGMFRRSKAKVLLNGSSNGFDVDYFDRKKISNILIDDLRKQYGICDSDFVFVSIGRIVHDKGIDELVPAFDELTKSRDNVHLFVLGNYEKDLDPILQSTEDIISKNSKIHLVGYQSDIRPFLMVSNALVHASHREGFGNVIAQAGLFDLPCIVTNICGPNEIIIEGKNGNIIPRKDIGALIQMMSYYCDNPVEVERMGKNARELIVSRYKRQDIWDALLKEYQSFEK